MAGRVVEVPTGRTVVIDADGRKLVADLRFIEVPEPEQPLSQTVREHLEKLVLGRMVEFRPQGVASGKATGQLYVDGVDVALQMLRDGAAWQIPAERSGQSESESAAYQFHQNQARAEQRGVWGVKDMKPAWQFRADKKLQAEKAMLDKEKALVDARIKQAPVGKVAFKRNGYWSDVNPYLKNPGPLVHGYNAASKTGYVGTSLMGIKELESMPADQKIAVDISYLYKQEDQKGRNGKFVLTMVSEADDFHFVKLNTIVVVVDEKNVLSGKPARTTEKAQGKAVERLTFEVSKSTIEKIVYGGEVEIKIGNYRLYPTQGLQLLLYNMLQVAG